MLSNAWPAASANSFDFPSISPLLFSAAVNTALIIFIIACSASDLGWAAFNASTKAFIDSVPNFDNSLLNLASPSILALITKLAKSIICWNLVLADSISSTFSSFILPENSPSL